MDSIQNNNVPQNFNNQSYNTPPQMNNKPPKSGLGIAALILSILGCTFIIGAILNILAIIIAFFVNNSPFPFEDANQEKGKLVTSSSVKESSESKEEEQVA